MTQTTINAESINTVDRQRKEFKDGPLQDLAESIYRLGLIHAPVLDNNNNLVAGERRCRALALIGSARSFKYGGEDFTYPDIPVHRVSHTDKRVLFEIELEENIRRVNLTPMEEANAIAQLHQLRLEDRPEQTRKDTAQELVKLEGGGEAPVRAVDEVRVANAILVDQFKDDPEVQKAAKVSLNKAAKLAKKKLEIQLIRALQGTDDDSKQHSMFAVYPGDCLEIMPSLPEASFDVMIFDPPYGVGADKFGEQAMDLGHQYEDDWDSANELTQGILKEGLRLLKPDAHVLMFCSFEHFNTWRVSYEIIGYTVWPRPLIWSKGQQAHAPVPDYGPRYSYECILFASRGARKINKLINDVIAVQAVRDKLHAAEKPTELLAALIDFTCKPGDRIIDPTCGSGSIFTAARDREVYVTGIELEANSYAVARERTK